ncbi:MAG: hypothetical protein H7070_15865 [Saprospiraceae bacterium]|nr:hypothetical protein [Pyrinomonadaceae bacterium]
MQNPEFETGVIKPIEVYKEAWEMIKDQYWIVFAVTLVGMLIGGAVPIVLIGPMMCGIYLVLFQKHEGRPVDFNQLFKGFDYFVPSLILAIIIMVPTVVLIFAIYAPMIAFAIAGPRMDESELMLFIAGTLAVEFVVAVGMVCLHTLLLFSFPLIVDKKLSAVEAIKLSARAVWGNLGGVTSLFVVGFGVCIVGYLMLCIGIYLVLPLIIAATLVAYRKVFPGTGAPNFTPHNYVS